MTDRVKALTVTLEKDIREDDIENLVIAISSIRGVLRVDNIISDGTEFITEGKVKREIWDKLFEFMKENL